MYNLVVEEGGLGEGLQASGRKKKEGGKLLVGRQRVIYLTGRTSDAHRHTHALYDKARWRFYRLLNFLVAWEVHAYIVT